MNKFEYALAMPVVDVRTGKVGVICQVDEDDDEFVAVFEGKKEYLLKDKTGIPDTEEARLWHKQWVQSFQNKINEAASELEAAFEKLNALKNEYSLPDFHYACSKVVNLKGLESVLDSSGWSSSSLYC